jgi:di- and tripeptidase
MKRLYEIYSMYDVGDIFSVAYCARLDTVYVGAQDTSIQWVSLNDAKAVVAQDSDRHPYRRYHPFFDSKAVGGTSTPRTVDEKLSLVPKAQAVLEMDSSNVLKYAQNGYVYCMLVAKGPTMLVDADEEVLITGGGEGSIKVWRLGEGTAGQEKTDDYDPSKYIKEIMCLGTEDFLSVMAIAVDGSFLYAGKLKGTIELWDLDTKQKLRVIKAHQGDVMSLNMAWGCLWSASARGSAAVCSSHQLKLGRQVLNEAETQHDASRKI